MFSALATSTRVIGLFLPISVIIFLFNDSLNKKKKNTKYIILILLFYFTLLYLHWPYLWENPFKNLLNFILNSKSWIYSYYILFNGEYYLTTGLPDSFIFTWIAITTPIFNLFIFMIGFYFILKRFFCRFIYISNENKSMPELWRGNKELIDVFIIFNLIAIISILVTMNVALVSGWRHLYFLNFFLVYIGIYFLYVLLLSFKKNANKILLLLFIFTLPSIYKIIIFHPFQSLYFNEFLSDSKKNTFLIDREGLSQLDSIKKILSFEKNTNKIIIANASYLPYYRIVDLVDEKDKLKLEFVGTNYKKADYVFNNFVYEVNPKFNNKYDIPQNFKKIYALEIDGIQIYEIYKKELNQ